MTELAERATTDLGERVSEPRSDVHGDTRVWVLRKHHRVRLRQAHAIVSVDWESNVARASCGLELRPHEVGDVPQGGSMPCVLCIAATPLPVNVE